MDDELRIIFEATTEQLNAMNKILVYAQELEELDLADAWSILDDIRDTLGLKTLKSLKSFARPDAGLLDSESAKFLQKLFNIVDDDKIAQVFD